MFFGKPVVKNRTAILTDALPQRLYKRAMVPREVVASLSIMVLVAFLAIPAMNKLRTAREATVCLNNMRQLGWAWQLYAEENEGKLVHNFHGGGTIAGANDPRNAPWATGWLDWSGTPDNTNMLYIRTTKFARLTPYLTAKNNVFKCPSDRYLSIAQKLRRWKQRVRSVSMNLTIGDGNAMTGPWDRLYSQAKTLGELRIPSPAETAVFLEEHPDSINDPGLFPPFGTQFIDLPGSYHQGAMNASFADGSARTHHWRTTARRVPVRFQFPGFPVRAGDPDLSWLSYHSQRATGRSY
jgi:prepilin-type processing-associated H-X9-DG protein